jgi:hypothetical protein
MCQSNEMYAKEFSKDGSAKHSNNCSMSFGRKDRKCHRCVEMLNGSPSRGGWQKSYYEQKQKQAEQDEKYSRFKHDCVKSHCSVVCTHGDW